MGIVEVDKNENKTFNSQDVIFSDPSFDITWCSLSCEELKFRLWIHKTRDFCEDSSPEIYKKKN